MSAIRSPFFTSAPVLSRKLPGSPHSLKRGRSPSPDDEAKPTVVRREKKKPKLLASGKPSATQQHLLKLLRRQKKVAAPLRNAFRKQVLNVVPSAFSSEGSSPVSDTSTTAETSGLDFFTPLQETSAAITATEIQQAAPQGSRRQAGLDLNLNLSPDPSAAAANLILPSLNTRIPATTRIAKPGQPGKSGPVPMPGSPIDSSAKSDALFPPLGNLQGSPSETLYVRSHDKPAATRAGLANLNRQFWHPYPTGKRGVKKSQVPSKNRSKNEAPVHFGETGLVRPADPAIPADPPESVLQVHLKEPAIGSRSSEECQADALPDAEKTSKSTAPSILNLPVEFQNSGINEGKQPAAAPPSNAHQISDVFDLACHSASSPCTPLKRLRSSSPGSACGSGTEAAAARSKKKKPNLTTSGFRLAPPATKQRLRMFQLLHRQRKVTALPKTGPGLDGGSTKIILPEQETARVRQAHLGPDTTCSNLPSRRFGAADSTGFATLEDLPESVGPAVSLEGSCNGSEKRELGDEKYGSTSASQDGQVPSEICTAEKGRPSNIAERGVELNPDPALLLLRLTQPEEHRGVRQEETSAHNQESREGFRTGGSLDSREAEERPQSEPGDTDDESCSSGMRIDNDEGKTSETSAPQPGLPLNSEEVYDRLVRYPDLPCTNAPVALLCELVVDLKSAVDSLRRSTGPEAPVTEPAAPAGSQCRSSKRGYGSAAQTAQSRDKKRQPPFLVNLKADVRRLMHEFLEYPEKDLTAPAPAQLKQYREKSPSARGPSLHPLVLDLASKGSSSWNKKAAKIFREEFLSLDISDCRDEGLIETAFLRHAGYLQKVYLKQSLDIGGKADAALRAKGKAKYARRKELRERRFKTALLPYQTISEIRSIRSTVSKFPMEVVSEDEREVVEGNEYYLVVKPGWRSSDGENLCEILDALHMASHFTADDRPRPGRFSHRRTASNQLYTGPAPPGLPSNLYRSEYLEGLTPEEVDDLNVQPEAVFSFPARIMRIAARFRHIECRGTAPLPRNDPSLNVYATGETYSAFIE